MENPVSTIIAIVLACFLLVGGCAFGYPQYNVYSARAEGEAKYQEAQSSRNIAVLEAKAKQESAKALAEAEVIRADGVAKANKIIGESLKGNDVYLHYLWLQTLDQNAKDQVVYIPTEANFPIMEANRLRSEPKVPELPKDK